MSERAFSMPPAQPQQPQPPKRPDLRLVYSADKPVTLRDEDLEEVVEELDEENIETLPQIDDSEIADADIIEETPDRFEPGEFQEADVHEAFSVPGFERRGLDVVATLEKKEVRKNSTNDNEDNIVADPETGLIGALDGLGGEGNGAEASKMAEQVIPERFKTRLAEAGSLDLSQVQQRIVEMQISKVQTEQTDSMLRRREQITTMVERILTADPKMGRKALALLEAIRSANTDVQATKGKTTASLTLVHRGPDGKRYAIVANIGDSMAYHRDAATGKMTPMTREDSLLNLAVDSGTLTPERLAAMKKEPDKKFPIPISKQLVMGMGGTEAQYQQLVDQGIREYPISYNN